VLVQPSTDEPHRLRHGLRHLGHGEIAFDDPAVLHCGKLFKLRVRGAALAYEVLVRAARLAARVVVARGQAERRRGTAPT